MWLRSLTSSSSAVSEHESRDGGGYNRKESLNDWWEKLRSQSQLNQFYSSVNSDQETPNRNTTHQAGGVLEKEPGKCTESMEDQWGPGVSTRRKKKRTRSTPTPTEYLMNALQNPRSVSRNSIKPPRLSLQTIVADYLTLVEPILGRTSEQIDQSMREPSGLDNALKKVFCERHLKYLAFRQYDVADVVSWAWILKSNTVYEAIFRIFILERNRHGAVQGVPPFIPLLLIRQPSVDTKAFRLILIYFLHLMNGQPLPALHSIKQLSGETVLDMEQPPSMGKPPFDHTMCITTVVRLLRHARQVWPQAQLPIARAFARYLTHSSVEANCSEVATERMNRFRAEKFNIVLWLLSLPSKPGPFTSVSTQQQAQFELLKAMAGHKPVLPVTRRGYQGIIATQLAHKKTSAERQSAELKSPSWPPWKEERLGIDSHRGIEGMKSRAMRVLGQMKEAGYSHTRWEEVSAIFAGWDTDRSPTVQTRTLMRWPQSLPGHLGSRRDHQAIWIARIRSTRTVREAWACFLSYQDRGLPPRLGIYTAMAEKLIFRQKANEHDFDGTSDALPGDGPEVFPEPSSARDLIYVHTEPPNLEELLKQMLSQGVRPSGKFLCLLLRSAPSFKCGLDYLRCSDVPNHQVQTLCTVQGNRSGYRTKEQDVIAKLPDSLFLSFIEFLCKFSSFDSRCEIRTADLFPIVVGNLGATMQSEASTLFSYSESSGDLYHPKTLLHAVQLIRLRNPQHPSSWLQLLSALGKDSIHSPYRKMSRGLQRILAWHEILEVVEWMKERKVDLGLQGFHALCTSFSRAVAAGARHPSAAEDGLELVRKASQAGNIVQLGAAHRTFADMVQDGLHILNTQFDRLVRPDPEISVENSLEEATDSQVTLPPMLYVPSPAVLHAFVRALGLAEDKHGLLNLLRWMGQSADTLKEASDELLNGERMTRRTIVAMRVFLEGPPWGDRSLQPQDSPEERLFSDPIVQEARDIVTTTSLWGPWPSDEEVWEYVHYKFV